jgi:hypothetical protein
MPLTFLTLLPTLILMLSATPVETSGAERHELRITDAAVVEWLADEESCDLKEAEFECLNHGDAYTIKAKMYKDCTGKQVYIQAAARKKDFSGETAPDEAVRQGFAVTKKMAAKDCPEKGECSLDTRSVCPLLDVAEVLNSDLVVIQRGD